MAFGVTTEGFIRKTSEDIISSLETNWKSGFGNDQDLSEDSVNSILIGIVSAELDEAWQSLEDVYNSQNPNQSDGVSLDNNAQMIGISRNGASSTIVPVSIKGTNATIIPSGSQASQSVAGEIFENPISDLIANAETNSIDMLVNALQATTPYSLVINGVNYTFNSDVDPTFDEIVDGLSALLVTADIGLTLTNNSDGAFNINADDPNDSYNISATSNIDIISVQSIIEFQSLNTGEVPAPINSIDTLDTSIPGVDSVKNFVAGQLGSDIETDTELRIRRVGSVFTGASNVASIKADLMNNVAGVSFVNVVENDTLSTVDSVDPKSIEAIIEGGSDSDIGSELLILKVGGISLSGNTTVIVDDSEGVSQQIKFSRPVIKFVHVRVTVNEFNTEEDFPASGEDSIKDNIVTFADNNLGIDDDIILQKLFSPVYAVEGLSDVGIEVAITDTPGGSPTFQSTNIAISLRELSNFDITRIEVITP